MLGLLPSLVPEKARPLASRPHLIPSIYLICFCGSLIPSSKLRNTSVTAVLVYTLAQIPRYSSGDLTTDDLMPIQAVLAVIHWVDFFIINSPDDYFQLNDRSRQPQTWWEKVKSRIDLIVSMRGVGWNWEVKNLPQRPSAALSKGRFVRQELMKASMWYLLFDLSWNAIHWVPGSYATLNPPDIFTDTVPRQLLFTWLMAFNSAWAGLMQHSLFSAVTVVSGLYAPQAWAPLMGRLNDVSTVRDMWGKFWHQMLRRTLNIPFNLVKTVFTIKSGTLVSRYLQLSLAFITSAYIHHIGALNVTTSSRSGNQRQLVFFMMQPLAIMAEDIVIYLGTKVGIKSSWKTKRVGQIWTSVWFSWSLRYMAAFQYGAGFMANDVMPRAGRLAPLFDYNTQYCVFIGGYANSTIATLSITKAILRLVN